MGTAQSSTASTETTDSQLLEEESIHRDPTQRSNESFESLLEQKSLATATAADGSGRSALEDASEGVVSSSTPLEDLGRNVAIPSSAGQSGESGDGVERNGAVQGGSEESMDGGGCGPQVEEGLDERDANGETREERLERKRAEMETFYSEVVSKREARNKALDEIAKKMRRMEKMEDELEKEREEKATLELHCRALKEVNKITKEMLRIRETQVSDLKTRLKDVEKKLLESPEEIKIEYEKQMSNYKKLRELYEQRALAAELEHKTMIEKELAKNALLEAKLKEIQEEIQAQLEKYKENKKQILEMEKNIQLKDDEINNLNESLTSSLAENHVLNSQMTLVNNLFSNMLVNPMINLDLLIKLIQDNYLLIIDLVNNHEINDTVSLLVDLEKKIDQETIALQNRKLKQLEECESASCSTTVDDFESEETSTSKDSESMRSHEQSTSSEHEQFPSNSKQTESDDSLNVDKSHIQKEIANNLPKVWKILIELLNTHQEQYKNNDVNENFESCYKSVKTTSGKTAQVISVSQTFIRLKHLILEKNHLTNQLAKLKTLNNHLEIRLTHSEQRLNTVTSELKKTWNVVNKLKLQHKQLYTHEKILKYELKHKRNIINDLKIDLEYVREKWDLVKEKNEQNELDYKLLRKEFAMRRLQYDGGRSTSESGISTDTEDDNVELVETNDESEDDKSEVVETQSEHDVPCTSSVMSIEEEDDQDEVEELENETNANESSDHHEAISGSMSERLELRDIQRDPSPHLDTRERQDAPQVPESEESFNELSSRNDTTVSNEGDNAVNTLGPQPSNASQEEAAGSKETAHPSNRVSCDETCSQIVLNNNKVTVKLIGGKLKVVTEHIAVENPTEQEASPNINEQSTKESNENGIGIETNSVASAWTPIESTSEEQRTAKQLIRQNRIAEEAIDKESDAKESLAPLQPTEESRDEQTILNDRTNLTVCESANERPLELRIESEPQRDSVRPSQPGTELQEVPSHSNGNTNSTACESTDKRLAESDSQNQDKLHGDVHINRLSTDNSASERPIKTTSDISSKSSEPTLLSSELPTTSSETSPSRTLSSVDIVEVRNATRAPTAGASSSTEPARTRTPEEILEARNARLKRLEDQTKNLFHKMSLTSQRSETLSERLVELHDYYGTSNERHSPRRSRGDSQECDERRDAMGSQASATSSGLTEVEMPSRGMSEERREVVGSQSGTATEPDSINSNPDE